MKTFFTTILLVWCLVLTGCPAKTIQKAKDSSRKLSTYANAGVNVTRDLYRQQLINLATKDRIADAFIVLAQAGITFDAAVANVERTYGDGAVPQSEIDKLFAVFDAAVVTQFVQLLQLLKIPNAGAYTSIIETLRTAVLLVAAAFKRTAQVEARLAV